MAPAAYGGERSGPGQSPHSYSACKSRMSESGASYGGHLTRGASSRANAEAY